MKNNASDFLKYANLQMAAESLFSVNAETPVGLRTSPTMNAAVLAIGNKRASIFPDVLAEQFVADGWTVIEHQSNTSTGFSGTLFLNSKTNKLVMSFRSTEFADDSARDCQATNILEIQATGWAFGQINDMKAWYESLVASGKLTASSKFAVTGYSLGGHLATAFNLLMLDEGKAGNITETYTFNGAGVGEITNGKLNGIINTFRSNLAGNADFFHDSVAKQLYLDVKGNLSGGATSATLTTARKLVNDSMDTWRASFDPSAYAARLAEMGILYSAINRALSVAEEADRVIAGIPSGGTTDGALKVQLPNIAAVGVDYQMAVLRASQSTASYKSGVAEAAAQAYASRTPITRAGLSKIYDIYGAAPPSAVANSQHHFGDPVPIFIEDQPLLRGIITPIANGEVKLLMEGFSDNDFGDTHSLVLLVDSLSVQSVLAKLAPEASAETLLKILESASNKVSDELLFTQGKSDGTSLENIVNSLADLFGLGWHGTERLNGSLEGNTWHKKSLRDSFYQKLKLVQDAAEPLAGQFTLAAAISDGRVARTDFAAFLSLQYLSPVILTKANASDANADALLGSVHGDMYAKWQMDQNLPAGDASGEMNYSDQYLKDRAAMLGWLLQRNRGNVADNSFVLSTQKIDKWEFRDLATSTSVTAIPQAGTIAPSHYVVFGQDDNKADTINGGTLTDYLYGGSGADELYGAAGSDYLEGNAGKDFLTGGSGSDELLGGDNDDTLIGGTESDRLTGGAGNDTYQFSSGDGNDTVIDSDAQGAIEINGIKLEVGKSITADNKSWRSTDNSSVTFTLISGLNGSQDIRIAYGNNDSILLKNYTPGALGITLQGFIATPVAGPVISNSTELVGTPATKTVNGQQVSYTKYEGADLGYLVVAGNGENTIHVGNGNNSIVGGSGNDAIYVGAGDNIVMGNGGQDYIFADGSGNNIIIANGGRDIIYGSGGINQVYANEKVDLTAALDPSKRTAASGQKGNFIAVAGAQNTVVGGNGNEVILLGSGQDVVAIGNGDTTVLGGVVGQAVLPTWSTSISTSGGKSTLLFNDASVKTTGGVTQTANFDGNVDPDGNPVGVGNATIYGGTGRNLIMTSNGNNFVDAGGGNSTVQAGAGSDTIFGGTGNVLIEGRGGDDFIEAGSGNGTIYGGSGNNTIYGGGGHSTIYANNGGANQQANGGNSYVQAGDGDTVIYGSGGNDTLLGGKGTDTIFAGDGDTTIDGGLGSDQLWGGAGKNVIFAGDGGTAAAPKQVVAGDGDTTVYGGNGIDHIFGGSGSNILHAGDGGTQGAPTYVEAGSGATTIYGGSGVDLLKGGSGTNLIFAGDGGTSAAPTYVYAGSGNTTVYGGAGVDRIFGGSGTSVLYAGAGGTAEAPTVVTAGSGDSRLVAGSGTSQLVGGSGQTTFVLNSDVGNATIFNYHAGDIVEFGAGATASNVVVSAQLYGDGSIGLVVSNGNGITTIANGLGGADVRFKFANGSILSAEDLIKQANVGEVDFADGNNQLILSSRKGAAFAGSAANVNIYALGGEGTMTAGSGTSNLVGGGGNDAYIASTAAASIATISHSTSTDTLKFASAVNATDIKATATTASDGTRTVTLTLTSGSKVVIEGSSTGMLSKVAFADGTTRTLDQLLAQVSSGTVTTTNPDGSYSTSVNDGNGNITVTAYSPTGVKLSDSWTRHDGSHGTDTFNSDGSSTGKIVKADGSYKTFVNNGQGNIVSMLFNAAGQSLGSTTATSDGLGTNLVVSFNAQGVKTGATWKKPDGSHGRDYFNADGSSSGHVYRTDGSHSAYLNDGKGKISTTEYDALGNQLGNQSNTTPAVVRTNNADGSYVVATTASDGAVMIESFSSAGVKTSDTWTKADGSYGHDEFSADGKSTGTTYQIDGTTSSYTDNGSDRVVTKTSWTGASLGSVVQAVNGFNNIVTTTLDANGAKIKEVWTHSDGTTGESKFGSKDFIGAANLSGKVNQWGSASFQAYGSTVSNLNGGTLNVTSEMWFDTRNGSFTGPDAPSSVSYLIRQQGNQNAENGLADFELYDGRTKVFFFVRQMLDGSFGPSRVKKIGANGAYSILNIDGQGNATSTGYSASGVKISEIWFHNDGSQGFDDFAPDGSASGLSVDANGDVVRYANGAITTRLSHTPHQFAETFIAPPKSPVRLATLALASERSTFSVASVTLSDGAVVTWDFFGGIHLSRPSSYTFDGTNYVIDPNGKTSSVKSRVDTDPGYQTGVTADGVTRGWNYDAAGVPLSKYDDNGQGRVVTKLYAPTGAPTGHTEAVTNAAGNTETKRFDAASNLIGTSTSTTTAPGQVTTTLFDASGDKTGKQVVQSGGDGNTITTRYNAAGALLSSSETLVTAANAVTITNFDGTGKQVNAFTTSTDAQGVTRTSNYDASGNLIGSVVAIPDSNGNFNTANYDAAGKLSSFVTLLSDGHGGNVVTVYDNLGIKLRDNAFTVNGLLSAAVVSGGVTTSTTYKADNSSTVVQNDGQGNVSTTHFNSAGVRLSASWRRADGSSGSDTFHADGTAAGSARNLDGSTSNYTRDNAGKVTTIQLAADGQTTGSTIAIFSAGAGTTTYFGADGRKLRDTWSHADGTDGSTVFNADGSYAATKRDGQGLTTTTQFNPQGVKLSDSWNHTNGSSGSDTFAANGAHVKVANDGQGNVTTSRFDSQGIKTDETKVFGDGRSTVMVADGQGNTTTTHFVAQLKTHDVWSKSDGTSGTNYYSADGKRNSAVVNDGHGLVTTTKYDGQGVRYQDNWTNSNGSYGGNEYRADGTRAESVNDGQGLSTNNTYNALGVRTESRWLKSDGTSGLNTYFADGSYSTLVGDGRGLSTTTQFNAQGIKTAMNWVSSDGSSGSEVYRADGSYTKVLKDKQGVIDTTVYDAAGAVLSHTRTTADGLSVEVLDDGQGNVTTAYFDAQHVKVKETWIKNDGTSGTNTYNAAGILSRMVNDGHGGVVTTEFGALGVKTGDSWTAADGTSGGSTVQGDGLVTWKKSADGSMVRNSDDGHGYTSIELIGADGKTTQRNVIQADGTKVKTVYGADGSNVTTIEFFNGNVSVTTKDSQGNTVATSWTNPDGSRSSTTTNPDGSSTSVTYAANGSYRRLTSDGQGNTTDTQYKSDGSVIQADWVHADGTRGYTSNDEQGNRTEASFSAQGRVLRFDVLSADGSRTLTVGDGQGNSTTTIYGADGKKTDASWVKVDGSNGSTHWDANGNSTGMASNADGSGLSFDAKPANSDGIVVTNASLYDATGQYYAYRRTEDDGKGTVLVSELDQFRTVISQHWSKANGTSGDGDGSYAGNPVTDSAGTTTITRFSVFGIKAGDSWTNPDGRHGSSAIDANGTTSGTDYNADGSYRRYSDLANGTGWWSTHDAQRRTTAYYNSWPNGFFETGTYTYLADGTVKDSYSNSDGEQGTNINNPDGTYSGTWYDPWAKKRDAWSSNAEGVVTTNWTKDDGSYGTDIRAADFTKTGTAHNVDGSSSSYTNDGQGNVYTILYDKNGYKIGDRWKHPDGSTTGNDYPSVNAAPALSNAIAGRSTKEAAPFQFVIPGNTFADTDPNDALTYAVTMSDGSALPAWLSFNATTATLSGTPADADVGTIQVMVTAKDKGGLAASTGWTLSVEDVNQRPVAKIALAAMTVAPATPFQYTLPAAAFVDPDASDSLSYSLLRADGSALPSWLHFDAATQSLSGTPLVGDAGKLALVVTAVDKAGLSASSTLSLEVAAQPTQVVVGNTLFSGISAILPAKLQNLTGSGTADIKLTGNALANTITANSGNDTLVSGTGKATLVGGTGNDTFIINKVTDVIVEKAGNGINTIVTPVSYTLPSFVQNIQGSGRANITLTGNDLPNVITANAGNTTLVAGSGLATLVGGVGNDTFVINSVQDVVIEQPNRGNNTIVTSVSYTLPANVQNLTATSGTAPLTLKGNDLNNVITGNDGSNVLIAGTGNTTFVTGTGVNTLIGGVGNDTYKVNNSADVIVEQANGGKNTVVTTVDYVLPANVHNLTAVGSNNLTLTGNNLNNVLTGNAGNSILIAGSGNTTLVAGSGATLMHGGEGNDIFRVNKESDVVVEAPNHGQNTIISSVSYTLPANVQNLTGTGNAAITLTGNNLRNTITGNAGKHTLIAGSGNATLIAGAGLATLVGGLGDDIFRVNNTADVVIEEHAGGKNTVQTSVNFTLPANVQNITAIGSGNVTITGNNLSNILTGNAGNHTLVAGSGDAVFVAGTGLATMIGGLGNNTYKVNNSADVIIAQANALSNIVQSSASFVLTGNLRNVTLTGKADLSASGGDLDDLITGNGGKHTLSGGAGNDTLVAGIGLATMVGGTGSDTYLVNNSADVILEQENSDLNTVMTTVSYVLPANVQRLTATGSASVTLTGNALAHVITANSGNDTLVAGSGLATLVGGNGSNTFVVNNSADVIIKPTNSGKNTVLTSVSFVLPENVQNMTGTGDAAIVLEGNSLNNVLIGHGGSHTLRGGAGADTLVAGTGPSTLVGGAGADSYVVLHAGDIIIEEASTDKNSVSASVSYVLPANVHNLTLTGDADLTATGNEQLNVLTGNNGNSTLIAVTGNATLVGGAGNDTLIGGTGTNLFKVNHVGDVVQAKAGAAGNTVQTSVSYVMPANTRSLTGIGSADMTLTGNELAGVLTGSSGNTTLIAGSGDATLVAGTGRTTMLGGVANNIYKVSRSDTVIVAQPNALSNSVLSTVSFVLPDNVSNLTGTGSVALALTGNAGNNLITGGSGNATLDGGSGNDTLVAGAGVATMIGGTGDDTYRVIHSADVIIEAADGGFNTVQSSVSYVLPDNVQNISGTGSATISLTGNSLDNVLTGSTGLHTLVGGAGNDTLTAGTGLATLIGGSGSNIYKVNNVKDIVIQEAGAGINKIISSVSFVLPENVQVLTLTGTAGLTATATSGNNLLVANAGNSTLTGGTGVDVLQGGLGRNVIRAINGSAVMLGGVGADTITGGSGADFISGGGGNDVINMGNASNVIAFNKGDGKDTLIAGSSTANTLSLGGGLSYADLTLSKSGSNLILGMGADAITLQGWYAAVPVQGISTLQMIEQASPDFDPASANLLLKHAVEVFDFAKLVAQFDLARAQNASLANWKLMDGLLSAHLSASDSAALGGDLAFYQGTRGNLSGLDLAAAVDTVQDAQFGKTSQTTRTWGTIDHGGIALQ